MICISLLPNETVNKLFTVLEENPKVIDHLTQLLGLMNLLFFYTASTRSLIYERL
jgi:hypothetical protein